MRQLNTPVMKLGNSFLSLKHNLPTDYPTMKKIFTFTLFALSTNVAHSAIEIPFELEGAATTPVEVTIKTTVAVFSRLDQIAESERTVDQQKLWTTLNYVATQLDPDSEEDKAITEKLYRAISPKANSANTTVTRKTPGTVSVKGIGKRLSALRKQVKLNNFASTSSISKPRNRDFFGFSSTLIKYNNPLEEGGLLDQRLSGFVSSGVTVSDQSETGTEVGFEGDLQQLTLGADYRLTNATFAGAAMSFSTGEVNLDNNNGKLGNSSQTVLLYGTYTLNPNWYVDSTLSFGTRTFELERKINFTLGTTTTDVTANSNPNSDFTGISIGTGYDKSWNNGHSISLLANFDYTQSNIDAFTEADAGGFNLAVGSQSLNSMQLTYGAEWRQSISTGFGVLLPQFSMNWTQEFETSSDTIDAYFIADPDKNSIEYKTGNKDQGYLNLKLGTSMIMPRGLSLFAQYETQQFVDDYQQYMISIGGRKEF